MTSLLRPTVKKELVDNVEKTLLQAKGTMLTTVRNDALLMLMRLDP